MASRSVISAGMPGRIAREKAFARRVERLGRGRGRTRGCDLSLASLTRTEFRTDLGIVPLWHWPGALESDRPMMVTVTGSFADPDAMSKMQQVVGDGCDCFLMHLPGNHTPPLAEASVGAFARALDQVLRMAFAERPVVLAGVSIGALVALAARAPGVRRVVAVEPPLVMGKLWPMLEPLRQKIAAAPDDADLAAFAEGVFGVLASGRRDLDYFHLFDGLELPVDVVVGDRPLMPERPQESYPSFVDQPERVWLERRPNVVLHLARGAGHNVPFQAPYVLKAVLLEALLAVGGVAPLSTADQALLSRAPLAAARVLYVGGAGAAFDAAYHRLNPSAAVQTAASVAAAGGGPYDLLLLETFSAADAGRVAALLADGGAVLAVARPSDAAALDAAPLSVVRVTPPAAPDDAFDDRAVDLWPSLRGEASDGPPLLALARKAPPTLPLRLRLATFAPRLMDVRTRLPAQGLRTDPELSVTLSGPGFNLAGDEAGPRVLVLQRPALEGASAWASAMAESLRRGWVVVLESDDHPELIAQVKNEAVTPETWDRFGYVHAVQTSTPQLAELFGRHNPEVKVFANCAFELGPYPRGPAPRRVFYGAVTRGPFAVEVAASLGGVAGAFPEVEWLVMGDRAVFDALPTANKRFEPYAPYDEYLRLMGSCAVSLSPIEGRPHQDTKSDVKWVEAAARGVVTVASPTIYARTIRPGETGLLAPATGDWAAQLRALLGDEALRLAIARRAWTEVARRRMFAQQVVDRRSWYQDLWRRRDALTEGVLSRLPGLAETLGR
jgi:hypothetical protein